MRALPSHPRAFESCLHDRFVRTFHTAAAKRPAQLLVKRILHLLLTLTQVVHLGLQIRHVWMLLKQKTNVLENRCGTLVLELVALRLNPVRRQFGPGLPDQLCNLCQIASCMGKIENPYGICSMQTHKTLDPLSPILHGTHLPSQTDSSALRFHNGSPAKGLCVSQTRKIGEIDGLHLLVRSLFASFLFGLHTTDDQGLGFHIVPSHQRDHGSITTDQQLILCCFAFSLLCLW